MPTPTFGLPELEPLTQETRALIGRATQLIFQQAGLVVPPHREGGIYRNLSALQRKFDQADVADLLNALEANPNHEAWPGFISCFTINHTAFFRESHHFAHLAKIVREKGPQAIWCAAASTGEEPYSIAMTLNEVLGEHARCPNILATDIDASAIEQAREAVYDSARIASLSEEQVKRHFLRGVDVNCGQVRVKKFVRDRVRFGVMNLNQRAWPAMDPFDAIFCRNTMIYFDQKTQATLLSRFASVLKPGGYLYIGHSENITPLTTQFKLLGQTVYQRS